jgi:hypothetical protein
MTRSPLVLRLHAALARLRSWRRFRIPDDAAPAPDLSPEAVRDRLASLVPLIRS